MAKSLIHRHLLECPVPEEENAVVDGGEAVVGGMEEGVEEEGVEEVVVAMVIIVLLGSASECWHSSPGRNTMLRQGLRAEQEYYYLGYTESATTIQ